LAAGSLQLYILQTLNFVPSAAVITSFSWLTETSEMEAGWKPDVKNGVTMLPGMPGMKAIGNCGTPLGLTWGMDISGKLGMLLFG
jgi:hypothetical protein